MNWAVIVNPAAGRGRDLRARTEAALRSCEISHEIFVSGDAGDVTRIVAEAVAAGTTAFASVGGDGTAHLVVNALMGHEWSVPPTLAILPAGSGSDFIRTFALPATLEDATRHLVDDRTYPCDVGLLSGGFGRRYFLNAANVGIAAASAQRAGRLPDRLGPLRYTIGFWLAIGGFRPGDVVVDTGRHRIEQRAMNVVLANGQYFGGGMNVAPRAAAGDGQLDLQVFSGPRRAAFSVMPRVARGTHLTHRAVRRVVAANATIACPDRWPVEADGEYVGSGPVKVSVLHHALAFKL